MPFTCLARAGIGLVRLARLALLGLVACAHPEAGGGPGPAASSSAVNAARGGDEFTCTQVMGVSVTGDWFGHGFEDDLPGDRWQVVWRKQAFVDLWADPQSELWALLPQSPCAARSDNPDRVVFTGVNWKFTSQAEWEGAFEQVVKNIRARYPGVRRIDLLTMLRGPGNQSCGDPKTVVQPYIDDAVLAVAARWPGVVYAGPRVEALTCEVFTKGGPHYTEGGMSAVARLYARKLPVAGCACRAKKP